MWAACCNWLCFDTGPQEISQGDRTPQAFSNSNFRTAPPVSEISCKACGISFAACTRKNPCMDCKNYYCPLCLIQANNGHSLCQICRSIRSTAFDRDELMKLRVKDLRDYLTLKDIPIDLCREKEDLVQLILLHKPTLFSADGTNVPTSTSNQSTANQRTDSSYTPGHPPSNTSAANTNGSFNAQGTAGEHLVDSDSSDPEENLAPGRRASLSDLTRVDDIEALSVRQLKEILARNFVNYKGCCEKWELMERVTRLYNEQKDLQQKAADAEAEGIPGTASDENICKVCMDCPIDCVLLECGHMVTCTKCGKRMSECPICRQYVVRAVHVFRS